MKKIIVTITVIGLLLITSIVSINAAEPEADEYGLILIKNTQQDEPFNGTILFSPWLSRETYLINNTGEVLHKWNSLFYAVLPVHLLENGNLLRADWILNYNFGFAGGSTGRVEKFSWKGLPLWNFKYSNKAHYLHHDIEPLPNGNVLMIAWEKKTRDEAIAAGRNPNTIEENGIWPDHIIEVEQTGFFRGEIVWEWHVWDHLIQDHDPTKDNYGVVADHPELININLQGDSDGPIDWLHTDSVDYNEELDQILLSSKSLNEIWVIDHSTNTTEAAGHTGGNSGKGGDILYRWGNPQNYDRGDENDQKLFHQHDARWILPGRPGEGHITVFNNGEERLGTNYTSIDEIVPPIDDNGDYYLEEGSAFGPEEPIWSYHKTDYPTGGGTMGSAERLPSGNTLICIGHRLGLFLEITPEKNVIWSYENQYPLSNPNKEVFSIRYYPPDYPGMKKLSVNIEGVSTESEATVTEDNQSIQQQIQQLTFLQQIFRLIGLPTNI